MSTIQAVQPNGNWRLYSVPPSLLPLGTMQRVGEYGTSVLCKSNYTGLYCAWDGCALRTVHQGDAAKAHMDAVWGHWSDEDRKRMDELCD